MNRLQQIIWSFCILAACVFTVIILVAVSGRCPGNPYDSIIANSMPPLLILYVILGVLGSLLHIIWRDRDRSI